MLSSSKKSDVLQSHIDWNFDQGFDIENCEEWFHDMMTETIRLRQDLESANSNAALPQGKRQGTPNYEGLSFLLTFSNWFVFVV